MKNLLITAAVINGLLLTLPPAATVWRRWRRGRLQDDAGLLDITGASLVAAAAWCAAAALWWVRAQPPEATFPLLRAPWLAVWLVPSLAWSAVARRAPARQPCGHLQEDAFVRGRENVEMTIRDTVHSFVDDIVNALSVILFTVQIRRRRTHLAPDDREQLEEIEVQVRRIQQAVARWMESSEARIRAKHVNG